MALNLITVRISNQVSSIWDYVLELCWLAVCSVFGKEIFHVESRIFLLKQKNPQETTLNFGTMSNSLDRLRKRDNTSSSLDVPWKYLTVKSVSKSVSTLNLLVHESFSRESFPSDSVS